MFRPRWILLPATALVAAAFAHPASAGEICVHQDAAWPCPAGSFDAGGDLQNGIEAAEVTFEPDTIVVGPGVYAGPFVHAFGTSVTIAGSGVGETTLVAGASGDTILETGGADVRDLTVRLPEQGGYTGIAADHDSTLSGLAVVADASAVAGRVGVALSKDASLVRSTVALDRADDRAVDADSSTGHPTVTDSSLSARFGVYAEGSWQETVVSRTTIDASFPLLVRGSRLDADNSVLVGPFQTAARATCDAGASVFFGDHLTIVGGGAGTGVRADCATADRSAYASVRNTVIEGVNRPWVRHAEAGSAAEFDIVTSSFRAGTGEATGTGHTSFSGNVDVPPGFGPDGLRPAAGSELIDAGSAGSETQPLDLDGRPRVLGEREDIGAFEFDPSGAPPPDPPAAPGEPGGPAAPGGPGTGGGTGTGTAPGASAAGGLVTEADLLAALKATLAGRRGTRYAHRFLVGGTLTIRWTKGRRVLARAKLTRSAAGRVVLRVKRTRRGRRVLRRAGRTRIVVRGRFTPTGRRPVRATRRATLRASRR